MAFLWLQIFLSIFLRRYVNNRFEMKKMFLITVSVALLGVMAVFVPKNPIVYAKFLPQDAIVTICCKQTELPCVNVGCGNFVQCDAERLQEFLSYCNGIDGISVKFCGDEQTFDKLQRQLRLQSVECVVLDGLTVISGFSDGICGGVYLDGRKVNVQMAFDGTTITLGSPLILDSY